MKDYFNNYISDIKKIYIFKDSFENEIKKNICNNKLLEKLPFLNIDEFKKWFSLEKFYKEYLDYNVWWDDLYDYYSEYIYKDKYWISDFFIEKDNTWFLKDLYNLNIQVSFYHFIWANYSILNKFDISEKIKIDEALKFLYIQTKRWNIEIRSFENDLSTIHLIYNKDNAELILTDLKSMYEQVNDKDLYSIHWIEIILSWNKWK